MGYSIGLEDFKPIPLVKSLIAELIGTMFLVLIGCGTAASSGDPSGEDRTSISLAFGLAVMAIACFTGHVSGGNLNPAVSIGLLAGGQLSLIKCGLYIVVQTIGSIAGAAILFYVQKGEDKSLGVNQISPQTTEVGGFFMELLMTMLLVLVVYATAVDQRNNSSPMLPPLLIGLTVTVAHLICIPFTGTSINPARSFGPSLILDEWPNHWVFWVGPLLGGAIGGVLYRFVFFNDKEEL